MNNLLKVPDSVVIAQLRKELAELKSVIKFTKVGELKRKVCSQKNYIHALENKLEIANETIYALKYKLNNAEEEVYDYMFKSKK